MKRVPALFLLGSILVLTSAFAKFILLIVVAVPSLHAQGRGGRGAAPVPQTGQAAAPMDMTGYWVSVVTADWRLRMLTPPKGDLHQLAAERRGPKGGGCMGSGKR